MHFQVRTDDSLPKAICHECLQQVAALHLYTVKVEKTQKFLAFHKAKTGNEKQAQPEEKIHPIIGALSAQNISAVNKNHSGSTKSRTPPSEFQKGDAKPSKFKQVLKKTSPSDLKFMEAMTLEEFANEERVDKSLLSTTSANKASRQVVENKKANKKDIKSEIDFSSETLDPVVLIDGRPARQGAALDKQISLFYKMECCICHEKGFHFRSLMRHYKDRHGVPGYVTCCEKKFHYFYPKRIIEHMAYHLQPNIFM